MSRNQTCSEFNEQEFMEQLYLDFERLMYHTANKYASDPKRCEDIVQDCIAKFIERVELLRGLSRPALASYIVITVRNTAINYIKKDTNEATKQENLSNITETHTPPLAVEDYVIQKENLSRFRCIWKTLDAETKQLLEGRYILGYNDEQLAKTYGCKPDSIRMKLTRARRKALNALRKEDIQR